MNAGSECVLVILVQFILYHKNSFTKQMLKTNGKFTSSKNSKTLTEDIFRQTCVRTCGFRDFYG